MDYVAIIRDLAWLVLLVPIVYVLLQNIITQIYVVSAYQYVCSCLRRKKKKNQLRLEKRIMPQMSHPKPSVLTPPMSTQTSELLGGSASGNEIIIFFNLNLMKKG